MAGQSSRQDIGLFIIRAGMGIMLIYHGFPKLAGGPELWAKVGGSVSFIKISFLPLIWGLLISLTEFLGGISLNLVFFFRPFTGLLSFVSALRAVLEITRGKGLPQAAGSIEMAVLFLGLCIIGSGGLSIDAHGSKNSSSGNY